MREVNGLPALDQQPVDPFSPEAIPARVASCGLEDLGYRLRYDSSLEPLDWRVVVEGPSMMVTSPSGSALRGMTFYVVVAPSGAAGQKEFVVCWTGRGYAGGGRTGTLEVFYRGRSLKDAIDKINRAAEQWLVGEGSIPDIQPSGRPYLYLDEITAALERGERFQGAAREELDALALREYRDLPKDWSELSPTTVLSYIPGVLGE